jgi:hypothetical protein
MNEPVGVWERAAVWLAPPAALLAPFIVLVTYHEYDRSAPEVLLVCAGLTALGLLAACVARVSTWALVPVMATLVAFQIDIQLGLVGHRIVIFLWIGCLAISFLLRRRAAELVAATALAILASALVWPASVRAPRQPFVPVEMPGHDAGLPPFVHLIVDEHIGIEGIPADLPGGPALREELRTFYAERGFALAGGAYSQYFDTTNSVPNLLNYASESRDRAFFSESRQVLERNAHFAALTARGYAIRVYGSSYLDLCAARDARISACIHHRSTDLGAIRTLPSSSLQKAGFLWMGLLDRSTAVAEIESRYRALRARRFAWWPAWPQEPRVGPLPVAPVIEQLRRDLASDARGTAFVAHLLHPHFPYVYDASCAVRPDPASWLHYTSGDVEAPRRNSEASRAERYARYFEQVRCLNRRLAEIFDTAGSHADATIVVHGDHGSRILEFAPYAGTADRMSPRDFRDAFSTLFAVRRPGAKAAYDATPAALQNLLADVMGRPRVVVGEPLAYAAGEPGEALIPLELPAPAEVARAPHTP